MEGGELVKQLIDAGIHFGHRTSHWNPKMAPYIYGKRSLIHIINVKETLRGILLAKKFLTRAVAEGKDVLIVGTKRQARRAVQETAERTGMHWVSDRWLGGTLTNFHEIRKRIGRLDELERMEADGELDMYSKKQGASLRREMRKIRRNLGGVRRMERMPGALVVIDPRREVIAVREARKMHIPVVSLLDTDSDPDLVDIAIPGNDDAMRGIELVLGELGDAIAEGKAVQTKKAEQGEQEQPRRRSRRRALGEARPAGEPQAAQAAAAGEQQQDQSRPAETEAPAPPEQSAQTPSQTEAGGEEQPVAGNEQGETADETTEQTAPAQAGGEDTAGQQS
ncbi:MAG: 30S ribosomal protein S2 [Planctomycetota bacterium]